MRKRWNLKQIQHTFNGCLILEMIWCGVALQGSITLVAIASALHHSNPIQFHRIWSPSIYSCLRESLIPEAWESNQILRETDVFHFITRKTESLSPHRCGGIMGLHGHGWPQGFLEFLGTSWSPPGPPRASQGSMIDFWGSFFASFRTPLFEKSYFWRGHFRYFFYFSSILVFLLLSMARFK